MMKYAIREARMHLKNDTKPVITIDYVNRETREEVTREIPVDLIQEQHKKLLDAINEIIEIAENGFNKKESE